jgi:hypothetical protein
VNTSSMVFSLPVEDYRGGEGSLAAAAMARCRTCELPLPVVC